MTLDDFQRALLDPTSPIPASWPGGWKGVLLLFLVPVGGGIPAGVLMAHARGIAWPLMMWLYFVSDVILAMVFEPMLKMIGALGRSVPALGRIVSAVRTAARQSAAQYGDGRSVLALVLVAFGVDPMTGRTAAAAAGHGFIPGWAIAITGDMFYFALLMLMTLWVGSAVGDDRLTIGIMLVVMFVLPALLRRRRGVTATATAGRPPG
ncbi:MAG TPA: hypothetical protein VGK20_05240 [Candidatus Binatia bacterium]|jgi:hypothetical protein